MPQSEAHEAQQKGDTQSEAQIEAQSNRIWSPIICTSKWGKWGTIKKWGTKWGTNWGTRRYKAI